MNSLVSIPSPLPTNFLQKKKREPTSSSTVPGSAHQLQAEHEEATCSGLALGSTSNTFPPPGSTSLSIAAERVAASTGCKVQSWGRREREREGERKGGRESM